MNKTKRILFKTAIRLFAEKGYENTGIEEITSVAGYAKGVLYYHFETKEELFDLMLEEGNKLLNNNIELKFRHCENALDKLKAILLIQIKIIINYEDFVTVVVNNTLGENSRTKKCMKSVDNYVCRVEDVINEYISNGQLVPDEITIAMVENKLDKLDGVLFDGFPRTINQAESLKKYMEEHNKQITAVIDLVVPDADIIKRTVSRVICSNKECGASYNTIFMPPKVEGICDKCGSKLIKRPDDNEETIKHRLEVYYKNTEPLINYYKNLGLLEAVDINIYLPDTKEITTGKSIKIIEDRLKNKQG